MTDNIVMPFALSTVEGPVLSTVEGLTTNGKAVVSHIYGSQQDLPN